MPAASLYGRHQLNVVHNNQIKTHRRTFLTERLGALTVAFALSVHGMNGQQEINPIYEAFEHVMQESSLQLGDFLALYLPDAYRTKGDCFLPKLPNLNAIGIRQCTSCGCTDMSGCREGCAWAGPTLCTACIPESLVPDLAV